MLIDRKFTAGKWVSNPTTLDILCNGKIITTTSRASFDGISEIERQYNAKAIAAIPQLVDALEAMYTMLESEGRSDTIIGHQITNTIKLLQ
jgi:hypothetical protein